MNEISKTIIWLLVDVLLVATGVELIKKTFSTKVKMETEETNEKYRLKTILSRVTINVVAVVFSVLLTTLLFFGGVIINTNLFLLAFYCIVCYLAQWFIDMALVKKLVEKIIDKVINKI